MLIFQLRAEKSDSKLKQTPKKVLTKKDVRDIMGKMCPDSIVNEIVKQKYGREKVQRINKAFKGIVNIVSTPDQSLENAKMTAGMVTYEFHEDLRTEKIASIFVKHADKFFEIAKAAGIASPTLIHDFKYRREFAALFEKYSDKFVEIAKAAGRFSTWVFRNLADDKKLTALFVKHTDKFVEIAKTVRENSGAAFEALRIKKIASMFDRNPDRVIDYFGKIARVSDKYVERAINALRNDKIAALFVKDPDSLVKCFGKIAKADEECAYGTFYLLRQERIGISIVRNPDGMLKSLGMLVKAVGKDDKEAVGDALMNDKIAALFVRYPDKFVEIAQLARGGSSRAFRNLVKEPVSTYFSQYLQEKRSFESFGMTILSTDSIAIELGRPLDDLHDNTSKRMKYLNSLSEIQIFGLLLSNPGFFYTSSNHLLMDRMQKILRKREITISSLLKDYKLLNTAECRNLIFRLINYDRFYGRTNSLLNENDIGKMMDILLAPIYDDTFDKQYYFLLANGTEKISEIEELASRLKKIIEKRLKDFEGRSWIGDPGRIQKALKYLLYTLDTETAYVSVEEKIKLEELNKKAIFYPKKYSKNGRLQVIQIFDRRDTEKDHWLLTQRWFWRKTPLKNRPKKDVKEPGELVYHLKNADVTLFMGKDENENIGFIRRKLQRNPNVVITFRGHSYSLERNMPYSVFGNKKANILFIPGSCGSAGSTVGYISANPKTNLDFFSNTSTGRGQVTNAIIDALTLASRRKLKTYLSILEENARSIEKKGGDIYTIRVRMTGENLLRYVESGLF